MRFSQFLIEGKSREFLEQLGEWIFAQHKEYELDQQYDNFVNGFYKAINQADEQYVTDMKRIYNKIKSSPEMHTVEDDSDFHEEFGPGDKVPLIDKVTLKNIYYTIQDANVRFREIDERKSRTR